MSLFLLLLLCHMLEESSKLIVEKVLASVGICVAILLLTPEKQSAKWVFTHVTDGSGWGSKTFSFFLGFISVTWTMTDYDGTTQ